MCSTNSSWQPPNSAGRVLFLKQNWLRLSPSTPSSTISLFLVHEVSPEYDRVPTCFLSPLPFLFSKIPPPKLRLNSSVLPACCHAYQALRKCYAMLILLLCSDCACLLVHLEKPSLLFQVQSERMVSSEVCLLDKLVTSSFVPILHPRCRSNPRTLNTYYT